MSDKDSKSASKKDPRASAQILSAKDAAEADDIICWLMASSRPNTDAKKRRTIHKKGDGFGL
jgi:hypothetical protein